MTNQLKFCYKTDQCIALNYFIHNNDKMKSAFVSRLIILSVVFAETYGMYERILLLYNVTFTFVERFQFHFSSKSVPFMIIKSSIQVFTFFTYNSSNCILIQHFFLEKRMTQMPLYKQHVQPVPLVGLYLPSEGHAVGHRLHVMQFVAVPSAAWEISMEIKDLLRMSQSTYLYSTQKEI